MNTIESEVEKCIRQKPNFQNITVSARAFERDVVKTGLNYCSKLFRFTIYYDKHGQKYVKSFFVKAPYGYRYYELITEFQFFTKEIYMYNNVIPLFKSLLPDQSLQPEFYGTDGDEALILEDLSYSGYKLVEAYKQMDFEHSAIALKLLAKFHALSVKIHKTEPQILDKLRDETVMTSYFLQQKELCALFNSRLEKMVRRAAPTYTEEHPEVLQFLKSDWNLIKELVHELRPVEYSFNVLNHGDFHTNNIMFADDECGQVRNAKCLDFQTCRWSSPAIDIIFFSITSMNPEVFQKYFQLLLEIYVQTLNATLTYLKCEEKLEMETLSKDIEKLSACWLHALIGAAPLIVSNLRNPTDDPFADEYFDDDNYVKLTKFWVPYFIEKGVFFKYEGTATATHKFCHKSQNENAPKTSKHNSEYDASITENFLSGAILLDFNRQSSIYLKIPSFSENSKMIDLVGTHYREIFMFENVLPKLVEPWNGKHLAPLCYAITKSKGLVLEDLEAQGYRKCDIKNQLDLDHCLIALSTLAKYHALTVKYIQDSNHTLIDALTKKPEYSPSLLAYGAELQRRFLKLAKTLVSKSTYQKLYEESEKFDEIWESLSGTKGVSRNFIVMAHGSFCTNSILFKYDDKGQVLEAKMVEWQFSRTALPVFDLVYFFTGSVRFEVFKAHRDTLLNLYTDTLNETLSMLKCNCTYTRADLDNDLNRYKMLFPMLVSCMLQILMTERDSQVFSFQQSNEISCGKYPSLVAKWLDYFVENGIL